MHSLTNSFRHHIRERLEFKVSLKKTGLFLQPILDFKKSIPINIIHLKADKIAPHLPQAYTEHLNVVPIVVQTLAIRQFAADGNLS